MSNKLSIYEQSMIIFLLHFIKVKDVLENPI